MDQRIADELGVAVRQVSAAVELLDGGSTVPFIARYRKEATGALDDAQLRTLEERLRYLRELDERRNAILKEITAQGKLTDELEAQIRAADSKARLEDLYLPYKPKRRTKAQIAREAGLEPLADLLIGDPSHDPQQAAADFADPDKGVPDAAAALDGARAILVERFAEDADLLGELRESMASRGSLTSRVREGLQEKGAKFADYFEFSEPFARLPSHRVLALFRGEKEEILDLTLEPGAEDAEFEQRIAERFGIRDEKRPADQWLAATVHWAWRTRILMHLSVDIRVRLWQAAEDEAVRVFAANLRDLLLAAPAGARTTIGLDPGFRTGVKVAVTDATGKVLGTATIYPHEPHRRWDEAIDTVARLAKQHHAELVAIGNGTASRETDRLAADLIKRHPELKLTKVVVSEAGASVYSASAYASEELPGLDVSLRGAVSIARRLQDPLAELVKIDPKSIGVGQYQHDVAEGKLSHSLDAVVEDCVNAVGVDLNTASQPLLARVSGVTSGLATAIVARRDSEGPFRTRRQLMEVPRLGPKAFEQCAGFLRIRGGDDPLDASGVHPEAYPVVRRILTATGGTAGDLIGSTATLRKLKPDQFTDDRFGLSDGDRHPPRAGEARPRPAPRVRHRDVRRGRGEAGGPRARHGARGRGDQRGRVRRVRRHRRAPGRPGARVGHVAHLRLRPPLGGQVRRRGAGEGALGRHPPAPDLAEPAAGRRRPPPVRPLIPNGPCRTPRFRSGRSRPDTGRRPEAPGWRAGRRAAPGRAWYRSPRRTRIAAVAGSIG